MTDRFLYFFADKFVAALDLYAITDDERYDGFYGICTDLNNPVAEIIELNYNRLVSEDCFRVLKTDFRARPAFVWTDGHIKAHFFCVLHCTADLPYTGEQVRL